MKILAIRGKNLASLGGDFTVELARPPLVSAGIFAIAGPTGAGKTTLLDAMCLALFDRTPRLNDRGGVRVGLPGEDDALWVASQDVRSLLRKGCTLGVAEVDFTGRDGRVYRARWAVRRARDRVDGQLQAQVMTLQVPETGELIGRTKSEVLSAIEARLGLSFEQFRRSALLAQGDFAAFLKAGERERAELLEQMTGTSLYGQVSVQAHERARREQQALEELRGRAGEVRVLTDADRSAMEAALHQAEADAEQARLALVRAEEAGAWHRQLAHLIAQEQEAQAQLDEAARRWESSAAERADLARQESLLPLVPLLERLDQAASALAASQREARARADEAASAAQRVAAADLARQQSAQAVAQARAALDALGPSLQQATVLDAEILAGERRERELLAAAATSHEAWSGAEGEVRSLQGEIAAATRQRDDAEAALRASARVAPVAAEWERWRRLLGKYFHAARALAGVDRVALAAQMTDARARVSREAQAHAELEARMARADEAVRDAEEREAAFDPAALRARREWLREQQTRVAAMARAAEEARSASEQRLAALDVVEQATSLREAELRKAERAAQERARYEAILEEARHALQQATAALDLTGRRASLVDGEPCPLCGAAEHPWSHEAPALDALVTRQQERVAGLERSRQIADRDETSSRVNAQTQRARVSEAAQRASQHEVALGEIRIRWGSLRAATRLDALPTDPLDPSAQASVIEAERQVEAGLGDVKAEEQRLEEATLVATRARREQGTLRRDLERARLEAERSRTALELAAQALSRAEDEIQRQRREQDAVLEELTPVFDGWEGWRDALTSDVESFGKECASEVTLHRKHTSALAEAAQRLAERDPLLQAALARAAERRAAAAERAAARREHEGALAALRSERAALLGGRPAVDVAAEAQRAVSRAETEERAAIALHEDAERRGANARGVAATQSLLQAQREAEEAEARAALDAALRAAVTDAGPASINELRAVAALGAPALQQRRAGFSREQQGLARAEVIASERRARRAAHEASEGPLAADAERAAEQASRSLVDAEERLSTARVRLADDDEQKTRAQGLGAAVIEQQRRVDLWGSLAQLIGSADGKKLRVFAQSLTFDSLLMQANAHLDELARRYQLMRVPGTDLDLQVIDREMADEVRPTTSLSGGESFLISLSLALALSSLGSRDTRVETLFIDEGFGTLDAESLEMALAALDALQGTGRQVGLISHIPGLVERLGAHVRVQPCGAGRSVVVASPGTE